MKNYDPRIWGSGQWTFLEIMVRHFSDTLTEDQQKNLKVHLLSMEHILPCEICRTHYGEYVLKTNLKDMDLSKKSTVKQWINNLHNERLKKPRSMAIVDEYYENLENKYITTYVDLLFIILFLLLLFIVIKIQLTRT